METFSALLALCALCAREFTGSRWIPSTRASDAELWCFFDLRMKNGWVNNRDAGDFRRYRAHYDVTVIYHNERYSLLIVLITVMPNE